MCGPVDSGGVCVSVDWTVTDTSGVTVIPGSDASNGSRNVGTVASTPLMTWYWFSTVPSTPSTADTGLSSPVDVTMTCWVELADAAGAAATDAPASAETTAAETAARRAFRPNLVR